MANTFDGDNLLITLEAVVDGVLTVDVLEDLYEDAKDWYLGHPDNRRYPFPFVSDGGNPLTTIIDQGAYIFLNNQKGWRIKPFENDGTYYFIGNLAVGDTSLPALIETDGGFTTAILGLQPVTQGVNETLITNLEQALFLNGVYVDPIDGIEGTGKIDGVPIGTLAKPAKLITDAQSIAITRGTRTFVLLKSLGLNAGEDFSAGYTWTGDRRNVALTNNNANLFNNVMKNMIFAGVASGAARFEDCEFLAGTSVQGYLIRCGIAFNFTLDGNVIAIDCDSLVTGLDYPVMTAGNHNIIMRNFKGSMGFDGMTGTPFVREHSIGVTEGRVIFESTCVGSNAHIRGTPFDIVDNSNGTTVLDETDSEKVNDVRKALYNRRYHDKTAKTVTLYAADNATPIAVWDAPDDQLTELIPQ